MQPARLNPDELSVLLAGATPASPSERRRHKRSVSKQAFAVTLRARGAASVRVTLHDLSRSGLGIHSLRPLAVGQLVDVQLHSPANPLRATCRVATCRQLPDGRHVIGLEFVSIDRAAAEAPAPPGVGVSLYQPDDAEHANGVAARLAAELGHPSEF